MKVKTIDVVNFIPYGHDNAVSRGELRLKTQMSDRDIREQISNARKSGVVILNLQNGNGYFRPTADELELAVESLKAEESRGVSILANIKALRGWIDDVKRGAI